jgi:hypothetical protein
LTGNIGTASWVSSIYRPEDVPSLGGQYHGPKLPEGAQQLLLERGWPEHRDETV